MVKRIDGSPQIGGIGQMRERLGVLPRCHPDRVSAGTCCEHAYTVDQRCPQSALANATAVRGKLCPS